jgi:HlyD family secretion protein
MSVRRRVLALAALALVATAAGLGYRHLQDGRGEATAVVLYGNVDLREVELAFAVDGRVERVLAEEGDRVAPGHVVAELDRVRFEAALALREAELEVASQQFAELARGSRPEEVRRAQAEVEAARAAQVEAELTYERLEQLVRERLASPQSRDDARAALDTSRARVSAAEESARLVVLGPRDETVAAARARVRAAEARLAVARKDLQDTRLIAPSNGVIQARILEPGDIAGPLRPVFTLALAEPVWVRAYVPEPDLARVAPGMAAEVTTDSFPGEVYAGRVGYVSPSAEFTPKSVETTDVRSSLVYQVRVLVPDPRGELRLGMPATVRLLSEPSGEPSGQASSLGARTRE